MTFTKRKGAYAEVVNCTSVKKVGEEPTTVEVYYTTNLLLTHKRQVAVISLRHYA